jgi:hypothetical protein
MEIQAGDFVKVVSGPAYVRGGQVIKGKVQEIVAPTGAERVAMVRVASGGLWGFMVRDLVVLPNTA